MILRRLFHTTSLVVCASIVFLLFPSSGALGADLKQKTVKAWNDYLQVTQARTGDPIHIQVPILWVDTVPDYGRRVHAGQILVAPAHEHMPKRVPGGLIHDWIGAVFIPGAHADDVLRVIRDYPDYKQFYRPTIVDSVAITPASSPAAARDRFSIRFLNRSVLSKTAFDADYAASYVQIGPAAWYGVGYTTRLREIRKYGERGERELPPDEGSGYIWRLYTVTRLVDRDGGVYMEVEAIALSRDIPTTLRWVVVPIVRRVSRDSIRTSLAQTEDAVRSAIVQQDRDGRRADTVASVASVGPANSR